MTTFDVTAALDAITRADHGLPPRAGDPTLTAAYDNLLRAAQDGYDHAQDQRDRADWLTQQCGGCHPGGTGETCDDHYDGEEA